MNECLPGAWRVYGRATFFALVVLFAVGAAGHAFQSTLPLMLLLTPWFSLLVGPMVLAPLLAADGWRFALWALATYAAIFAAEVANVSTGAIFGEYAYGPTLGISQWGVPLIIAFNWMMVVNGTSCIAGRIVSKQADCWRIPAVALLAGMLTMGFDFVLEPVAIRLDYWTWAGGTVPLSNYLSWFGISALAAAFHPRQMRALRDMGSAGRLGGIYVVMQTMFFVTLRLIWHLQGS